MWDLRSLRMAAMMAISIGKPLFYTNGDSYKMKIAKDGTFEFRKSGNPISKEEAPFSGWNPTKKTLATLSRGRRW